MSDKDVQRDANGRLLPGAPGRPRGAKNRGSTKIKELIERIGAEQTASGESTKLEAAITAQWHAAMNGDLQALHFLFMYTIGKPRQQDPEPANLQTAVNKLQQLMRDNSDGGHRPKAEFTANPDDVEAAE